MDFRTTIAPGLGTSCLHGKAAEASAANRRARGGRGPTTPWSWTPPATGRMALPERHLRSPPSRVGPDPRPRGHVQRVIRSHGTAVQFVTVLEEMPVPGDPGRQSRSYRACRAAASNRPESSPPKMTGAGVPAERIPGPPRLTLARTSSPRIKTAGLEEEPPARRLSSDRAAGTPRAPGARSAAARLD